MLYIALFCLMLSGCGKGGGAEAVPPTVPTNVTVKSSGASSLTFSWDAVPGAVSYNYRLVGTTVLQSGTTGTTVSFSDLANGAVYLFSVQAVNGAGSSAFSESVAGTPGSAGPGPGDDERLGLPQWEDDGIARAFPGAEGGGMYVTGGRAGAVYRVTNLNDSGPGSLREAIGRSGARTIVFDVDGVIALNSTLEIKNGDLTIAGQTAPGDGICLKNYSLVVKADNVIIRFIRCRMGDEKQTADDAMWGRYRRNIIIDHCSMSWSTDECSSFYANENFTMQWCLLTESLRNSVHGKGTHGYGAIWGGVNASYHHNLLAHHDSRNPRFDGGDVYETSDNPLTNAQRRVDYRNCVVYNFSNQPAYGGEGQSLNFVDNYYKHGPASTGGPGPNADGVAQGIKFRKYFYLVQGVKDGVDYGCPVMYASGNYLDSPSPAPPEVNAINADNWNGGFPYDAGNKGATGLTRLDSPLAITPGGVAAKVTSHTAAEAFEVVLAHAGASLRRDAVDLRAVNDALSGTATITAGGNGSINGFIDSQADAGGWPSYSAGVVKTDGDGDGIPDFWEEMFGLDKNSAADGKTHTLDNRYTNLELYLHWLVKDIVSARAAGGEYITQN